MKYLPVLAACCLPVPAFAQDLPVPEFIGEFVLPTGLAIAGQELGGLSDLAYDPASGHFLAISDDRVESGPARAYELALDIADGRFSRLDIVRSFELKAPGGFSFGLKGADPEGIAFDPRNGLIYWSSERDQAGRPAIYVTSARGGRVGTLPLPDAYLPDAEGHGIYSNLAFEGLDLSADGRTLIAATENALQQDGAKASLEKGSPARILTYDTGTLKPTAEYVYMTETVASAPATEDAWRDNGLSGLMALPDGRLVTVERSYAEGVGFEIRFFVTDIAEATNVAGQDRVELAEIVPARKTPWFSLKDGSTGFANPVDNVEAIAFGPVVDGKQIIAIASDNNFNPEQVTQIALFAMDAAPE